MAGLRRRLGRARRRLAGVAPAKPLAPLVKIGVADPRLPELSADVTELRLRLEGLTTLFGLIASCPRDVRVTSLVVEVTPWRQGQQDLALRVGHVTGLTEHSVRFVKNKVLVSLRTKEPTPLAGLLEAVVPVAAPAARRRGGAARLDLTALAPSDVIAPYVAITDRVTDLALLKDDSVRPTDVLVVGPGEPLPAPIRYQRVVLVGTDAKACVDPAVHRPNGRADFTLPALTGSFDADGAFEAVAPDGTVLRPTARHGVTDRGVTALMKYSGVRLDRVPEGATQVRVLRQLSAAGLVVSTPLAPGAADVELARLWAQPCSDDAEQVELASVRQRVVAHRDHSTLRLGGDEPVLGAPSISLLLSSNRVDHLEESLRGLAQLRYPRLQLVLGLHGVDAPAELDEWLAPLQAHADVVVLTFGSDVVFGDVLSGLSAVADGELLSKVDDDDHYGPDHLWDLVTAHEYSGAAVVGKGAENVYLVSEDATLRRDVALPERLARAVAGGTLLFSRADLMALGGWRAVPHGVDRALLDRVLRTGAGIYRTHSLNYVYVRRQDGHTWDMPEEHFLKNVRHRWDGLVVPST